MPSDAQRVQWVKKLVEAGFSHRVLLSHDIGTKHRLVGGRNSFNMNLLLTNEHPGKNVQA